MKKIYLLSICLVLSCLSIQSFGQDKIVSNQFNTWIDYVGNHKVADKWSIHTLASLRRSDFLSESQQFLIRLGGTYRINEKLTATVGYDFIETYPYGEQPIAAKKAEHRIFEHLQFNHRVGNFYLLHRYRLAHRVSNKKWSNRLRYRFTVRLPIGKPNMEPNTLFVDAFNELFLNIGSSNQYGIFNQNWAAIGLGYKTDFGLSLRLSYMNQYLPKSDQIRIENNHTLNLGLGYSLDLRKSKE